MDKAQVLVPILPPDSFSGFGRWLPAELGHSSPVFTAFYTYGGSKWYLYCKPYRPGVDKALFNEIAGYITAHCCNLPQPSRAFVATITAADIPDMRAHCPEKSHGWMYQTARITLFATAAIEAPWLKITESGKTLDEDIARWPTLGSAAVLDDTIANTDRHPGNLVRTDADNFALIDNGKLITETDLQGNWTAADINNGRCYHNALADLAQNHHRAGDVIHAAGTLPPIPLDIWVELHFWARELLSAQESSLFLEFLNHRFGYAPCLLKTRYHMI